MTILIACWLAVAIVIWFEAAVCYRRNEFGSARLVDIVCYGLTWPLILAVLITGSIVAIPFVLMGTGRRKHEAD